MIVGIGVDIIEVARIRTAMENERFLERNFSKCERAYFKEKQFAPETVAANFAAKEAFSKALGTGIRNFSLCEVSALRDEMGKPYFELAGEAKARAEEKGIEALHLSLSHTKDMAIAYVIAETNKME